MGLRPWDNVGCLTQNLVLLNSRKGMDIFCLDGNLRKSQVQSVLKSVRSAFPLLCFMSRVVSCLSCHVVFPIRARAPSTMCCWPCAPYHSRRVQPFPPVRDVLLTESPRPSEYNTLSESASGSEPAGDDEPHMIVEEEPGDEEDPVAAAAGIGRLNLSGDGHKDG